MICTEIVKSKDLIGFKLACSKIGTSLRDDFSEIDSANYLEGDTLSANNVRVCLIILLGDESGNLRYFST